MSKEDERRNRAKALRYKKAVVKNLSMELIDYDIMEMMDACGDVQWAYNSDLADDLLGEDEAAEFKMMFASLYNDIERFYNDVKDYPEFIPECYDDFMVVLTGLSGKTEYLGFDSYEEDYFGIVPGFDSERAVEESQKRLERLTKKQIIDAAQMCFNIGFQYIGLRNRFNELKASIDVLSGAVKGFTNQINSINEAYEAACSGYGWEKYKRFGWSEEMRKLDSLLNQFDPYDRIWIE